MADWEILQVDACPGNFSLISALLVSIKCIILFVLSGLIFIPNPFTPEGVHYWINRSFEDYCQPPNPTNIKEPFPQESSALDDFIEQKLRWATLGYHHNWDTKVRCHIQTLGDLGLNSCSFHTGIQRKPQRRVPLWSWLPFESCGIFLRCPERFPGWGGHRQLLRHGLVHRRAHGPLGEESRGSTPLLQLWPDCHLPHGRPGQVRPPYARLDPQRWHPHHVRYISSLNWVPLLVDPFLLSFIHSGPSRLCYHAVPKILKDPNFSITGRWSSVMAKMRLNLNVRQVNLK